MKPQLSEDAIRFLITPRLLDASDPKVGGSYTMDSRFVPDDDQVIVSRPDDVEVEKLTSMPETNEFLEKSSAFWSEYKKTEKGKHATAGPIIIVAKYSNNGSNNTVYMDLRLITYPDFLASYGPNFTKAEKNRNYSFGTNSLILTIDNQFIFGIRNPNISAAGGKYEAVGGFLSLDKLIHPSQAQAIKKMMAEERYWPEVLGEKRTLPMGIPTLPLKSSLPLEKYEELGLKPEDISDMTNVAFTKKDLYQNYNLFMFVNTPLEAGQVIEKAKKWGDGEIKAISVPVTGLDEWILKNKQDITPTLKSVLKSYYMG